MRPTVSVLPLATCGARSVVRAVVVETADSGVARFHECGARAPETCKIRKNVSAPNGAQTRNARKARITRAIAFDSERPDS